MTGNPANVRRAVLWDLDGTLLDSEQYHWLAWRRAIAAEGRELSREKFLRAFGLRNDAVVRAYLGPATPAADIERISSEKEQYYRELVVTRGIELLPGVRQWLERLQSGGWGQAIASSAPRLNIEVILKTLGIASFFEAVVSGEDIRHGKPDPGIFLEAAAKLAVPASRCVVVEDAPSGIEAARRAGMRGIGVLSSRKTLDADVVVSSLSDLPSNAFDKLVPPSE